MARCPQCHFLTRHRPELPCAVCASGVAVVRGSYHGPQHTFVELYSKPAVWDRASILAAVQRWCRAHPMGRLRDADCRTSQGMPSGSTILKYWAGLRAVEEAARAGLRQEGVAV